MPLSLLIPIFGLFGSYVLLGEEVGLYKVLACFIIVIALIINTFGEKIRSRIKIFNK